MQVSEFDILIKLFFSFVPQVFKVNKKRIQCITEAKCHIAYFSPVEHNTHPNHTPEGLSNSLLPPHLIIIAVYFRRSEKNNEDNHICTLPGATIFFRTEEVCLHARSNNRKATSSTTKHIGITVITQQS